MALAMEARTVAGPSPPSKNAEKTTTPQGRLNTSYLCTCWRHQTTRMPVEDDAPNWSPSAPSMASLASATSLAGTLPLRRVAADPARRSCRSSSQMCRAQTNQRVCPVALGGRRAWGAPHGPSVVEWRTTAHSSSLAMCSAQKRLLLAGGLRQRSTAHTMPLIATPSPTRKLMPSGSRHMSHVCRAWKYPWVCRTRTMRLHREWSDRRCEL